MREVYSNSRCNIAASASIDPNGGLFRPRNPGNIQLGLFKISDASTEQYFRIIDRDYWDRQVERSELLQRGWVFQVSVGGNPFSYSGLSHDFLSR